MAALAQGAAGAAGGGGEWTVLVPTAMAAEWTALTLPGGRARVPAAAGATAARGGGSGGGVPEVAVEMAALLAASGAPDLGVEEDNGATAYGGAGGSVTGHGAGGGLAAGGAGGRVADAGRPYFVPLVFVPSIQAKEEDTRITAARVIYGILLFGPLAYVTPINNSLQARNINNSIVWQTFGCFWVLLSIGFHLSLHRGLSRAQRAYIQHVAHFSMLLVCSFVVYYLYLLMPTHSTTSLVWLIEAEALLVVGHLGAWIWIVLGITVTPPEASTGYNRGTQVSQEGLPIWSRHGWDGVKQGLQGVTRCCAKVRDGWPRVWAKIRQVCSKKRKKRSAV